MDADLKNPRRIALETAPCASTGFVGWGSRLKKKLKIIEFFNWLKYGLATRLVVMALFSLLKAF